ncbi:hypothetical protein FT643_16725 [Ketobacter sp. MCCC 1A13808]|uniref:hypothetical protein n=1 Tax=Ketobacter sp. MCCC 1A13808 TaxID=2602738 RepID=UPI0012EC2CED|nr:hypothetical protein [Ketobacter sp. MCCC 1A13808]MVF13787.1 hypothetical protein [Ketobacter sp. MCCC 1A13808]
MPILHIKHMQVLKALIRQLQFTGICLAGLLLLSACSDEEKSIAEEPFQQQFSEYNADSWKNRIPDTCTRFFDGCNQCRRAAGSMDAACTRKACEQYMEPTCLDDEMKPAASAVSMMPQKIDYLCDGNNQFSIYYGTYISGDQRIKLTADDVVFSDRQTLTADKLTRKALGSGEFFSNGKIAFLSQGDEAQITLENELLYTACKIQKPEE